MNAIGEVMKTQHTFSIPVMGIGFTLDTPLKVSKYGIDSVISLVDDLLMEKIRKIYCEKFKITYKEITNQIEDFRAKRITSYLNLMNDLAKIKFDDFKNSTIENSKDLKEYINLLPISDLFDKFPDMSNMKNQIKKTLSMGSIDVNIMTKLDKVNYNKDGQLPVEYNDAHAALRGYANSDLCSSLVLSAGMNPSLYNYIAQFEDFFPDKNGKIKKKIILKVSDFRSALIQGRILAKKGLWVSEYRIESGLNCGGHAFATDGVLIGPILSEFKNRRSEFNNDIHGLLIKTITKLNRQIPETALPLKITVQGGVGSAEEHSFLLDHYNVDSVGWGTPFLLVPEATAVDDLTLDKLAKAKEEDVYLSNISPLGVPFYNLSGNTKDMERQVLIDKGTPGSSCPKEHLSFNTEFTEKSICTASRQYQNLKIQELEKQDLSSSEHRVEYNKIIDKSCICVGLGTASLLVNNISTKVEGDGVSVCPGPNVAYFPKIMSLKEITGFIYGNINNLASSNRPNMYIKELSIYIDYLGNKIDEVKISTTKKQEKYFKSFIKNLESGISYYEDMFSNIKTFFSDKEDKISAELKKGQKVLELMTLRVSNLNIEDK